MAQTKCDTPPSSLMDSITNPKMTTMKKGVVMHFLVRSTLGLKGHAGASR